MRTCLSHPWESRGNRLTVTALPLARCCAIFQRVLYAVSHYTSRLPYSHYSRTFYSTECSSVHASFCIWMDRLTRACRVFARYPTMSFCVNDSVAVSWEGEQRVGIITYIGEVSTKASGPWVQLDVSSPKGSDCQERKTVFVRPGDLQVGYDKVVKGKVSVRMQTGSPQSSPRATRASPRELGTIPEPRKKSSAGALRSSWVTATTDNDAFAELFYATLFADDQRIHQLFDAVPRERQGKRFVLMLDSLVTMFDDDKPRTAAQQLRLLGERHGSYGTTPEHFAVFGEALVATLKATLGAAFTDSVELAWMKFWTFVTESMVQGLTSSRGRERRDKWRERQRAARLTYKPQEAVNTGSHTANRSSRHHSTAAVDQPVPSDMPLLASKPLNSCKERSVTPNRHPSPGLRSSPPRQPTPSGLPRVVEKLAIPRNISPVTKPAANTRSPRETVPNTERTKKSNYLDAVNYFSPSKPPQKTPTAAPKQAKPTARPAQSPRPQVPAARTNKSPGLKATDGKGSPHVRPVRSPQSRTSPRGASASPYRSMVDTTARPPVIGDRPRDRTTPPRPSTTPLDAPARPRPVSPIVRQERRDQSPVARTPVPVATESTKRGQERCELRSTPMSKGVTPEGNVACAGDAVSTAETLVLNHAQSRLRSTKLEHKQSTQFVGTQVESSNSCEGVSVTAAVTELTQRHASDDSKRRSVLQSADCVLSLDVSLRADPTLTTAAVDDHTGHVCIVVGCNSPPTLSIFASTAGDSKEPLVLVGTVEPGLLCVGAGVTCSRRTKADSLDMVLEWTVVYAVVDGSVGHVSWLHEEGFQKSARRQVARTSCNHFSWARFCAVNRCVFAYSSKMRTLAAVAWGDGTRATVDLGSAVVPAPHDACVVDVTADLVFRPGGTNGIPSAFYLAVSESSVVVGLQPQLEDDSIDDSAVCELSICDVTAPVVSVRTRSRTLFAVFSDGTVTTWRLPFHQLVRRVMGTRPIVSLATSGSYACALLRDTNTPSMELQQWQLKHGRPRVTAAVTINGNKDQDSTVLCTGSGCNSVIVLTAADGDSASAFHIRYITFL